MTGLLFRYWGKARSLDKDGPVFHLLACHCLDVAAVGVEYLARADWLRTFLLQSLGISSVKTLKRWIAFWLLMHDLGKFAESFQGQRPDVFMALRARSPDPGKPYTRRHDALGMLLWAEMLSARATTEEWFGPETASFMEGLDYWMRAVTGHHGQPPNEDLRSWRHHFNAAEDSSAILKFLGEIRTQFLTEAVARVPRELGVDAFCEISRVLSWWIAGITVLADWLGSNTDYFAYRADLNSPAPLWKYWRSARRKAAQALNASGVVVRPSSQAARFDRLFPSIQKPSSLQSWAASVELMPGPQIHLLEDVTGAGKTEAAVMLANRLIAARSASGLYVALPTMATANSAYNRIAPVYRLLFADPASLTLSTSQSDLVAEFAKSILPAGYDEQDVLQADETASARCTAWIADHSKRKLLAPASVGTIDQALLAVLQSKHQSLRLLGLFHKILIVDEVHACDAYMQRVLECLLEFHGRAGGSAILLSATLPQQMRQSLVSAFTRGCRCESPVARSTGYPLVTSWSSTKPSELKELSLPARDDLCRTILVRYSSKEDEVVAAIEAQLTAGKCVCWMRNTVADVCSAYIRFRERISSRCLTLFHSRFALKDRLEIEARVEATFGSYSTPESRAGQLLIATQVVEQSLDVDFDLIVTDLAPVDRIIQRAGRLLRHRRDRLGKRLADPSAQDERGTPCLWVFGPEWTDEPRSDWFRCQFPKAASVYPNHGELWLTAAALRSGRIVMPQDARALIESVFDSGAEIPPGLQWSSCQAEGKGYADTSLAQQNTLKLEAGYELRGNDWSSEGKAPSRLGESTVSVLLARWECERLIPWTTGEEAWISSSIRVPERLIARRSDGSTMARKAAVESFLQSLPGKARWSVLLPLENVQGRWIGEAWSSEKSRGGERLIQWTYDPVFGLHQVDDQTSDLEDVE